MKKQSGLAIAAGVRNDLRYGSRGDGLAIQLVFFYVIKNRFGYKIADI